MSKIRPQDATHELRTNGGHNFYLKNGPSTVLYWNERLQGWFFIAYNMTDLDGEVRILCTCGRRTPFPYNHATDCPIYSPESKGVCGKKAECMVLDHIGNKPVDELGKVWDVLHAAGINGAGGMSAAEGVQALIEKLEVLPPPNDPVH